MELYSPMKGRIFIYMLVLFCILSGCQDQPTEQGIVGVWVGNYQGKRIKIPLPAIYEFFPDSTYEIIHGLSSEKESGNWKLTGNLLQLGDSSWHAYFRKGGKLNFKRNRKGVSTYLMLRRPEKNSQLFSLEKSNQTLSNTAWTNIREIPQYGFSRQDVHTYQAGNLVISRRYFYNQDTLNFSDKESFCYELRESTDQQFILFANHTNCSRILAPRQILQLNEDQLALLSYFYDENHPSGGEILPHIFYISLADSLYQPVYAADSLPMFAPCRDETGRFERGFQLIFENGDTLISHFQHTFQDFPNSQSGQIEIYLTVDCHGRVGRVNLIQKDDKRQPIYFAEPIVKQLFEMTVTYPYRANPESGGDSRRKLVFEIEDGKLEGVKVGY